MKKGGENPINNTLLRESTLKSIAYLQSKVYIQEKEVYELIRAFFKEYLGLDYEFTHDELLIELQNVFYDKRLEDTVLTFLRKVSKVEYSDEAFTPEQLKTLLEEFGKIVDLLIKIKRKDKGFLQRLMFWKGNRDSEPPVDREEEDEIAGVIEDMEQDAAVDKKKDLFDKNERPINNERLQEDQETEPAKEQSTTQESTEKPVVKTSNRLEQISQEINTEEENSSTLPESSNAPPKMDESKSVSELLAEFDANPSHESYAALSKVYEALPDTEKAKYYDAVMNAYNLLKNLSSSEENS